MSRDERRRGDDERAPIRHAHLPGDEAALCQSIEDAGQCRAFVGEPLMKLLDGGGRRHGELGQDVRFALGQAVLAENRQIQADSMRRPMDVRNELK